MPLTLSGTKERIFDIAVKLISDSDYESINLRSIAKEADIKASSIYNHFASKKVILDSIYEYYTENLLAFRKSDEEVKEVIRNGTSEDIINAFSFTFENPDPKLYMRMILITKIIYLRIVKDKAANYIFLTLLNENQKDYLTRLLDYGVSIGRFSEFDTKTFATILIGSRHIMGITAFSLADYSVGQLEVEKEIKKMFAYFLPIKK